MPNWKSLRSLLARSTGSADEHVEAGNELMRRDDVPGALGRYEAAIAEEPSHPRAHFNLGIALQRLGRPDDAARHYAVAAEAGLAKAWVNWGNVLKDRGDLDGAYELYRKALAVDPDDVKALVNCGTVLIGRGDLDGARELYESALALESANPDALSNLASIVQQRGEFAQAKRLYAQAVQAREGFVDAQYNLALIALHEADFEGGWEGYELRFRTDPPAAQLTPLDLPMAQPADLASGKRIAIRKEQGIGDQLLFATLLPELSSRAIDAVVETDPRLIGAFRRSLPQLEFATPEELMSAAARCDLQFPVGSLPLAFRRSLAEFRSQPARLLEPDPARMREIESRLAPGPKIGIAWRSFQASHRRHIERRKSAALESLAALGRSGARLVDLQYGDVEQEREAFDIRHPGLRVEIPGLDLFNDLEGLLAAIALCDRVVTTSNVTAHFAGAIGKRTWVVYPAGEVPFHYWVAHGGTRSLWYPSVEVMADPAWKDWDQAFAAVAERLGNQG